MWDEGEVLVEGGRITWLMKREEKLFGMIDERKGGEWNGR